MKSNLTKKMISRILATAIVGILAVSSFVPAAEAYTLTGKHITNILTFVPHSSFGATSVSHMNEACYQWNSQAGKNILRREPTRTHNSSAYPSNDGNNYVYKVDAGTQYLAQCTWYSNGSVNVSADININPHYAWANSAQSGCYDLWTVFLHETGHAAGLSHSSVSGAVMWPTTPSNFPNRYPQADDRAGINAIYK